MKNIFQEEVTEELIQRIHQLNPDTQGRWGKMEVAQMLAHCNVMYEKAFEGNQSKPGILKRFLLKFIVKPIVVSEKPYKKNSPTASEFVIKSEKDFELEKSRLITFLQKTQKLGREHFDGKEYISFGSLSAEEWNNMFYKHLNHHLTQFGV